MAVRDFVKFLSCSNRITKVTYVTLVTCDAILICVGTSHKGIV